jgi:hypothetical protein
LHSDCLSGQVGEGFLSHAATASTRATDQDPATLVMTNLLDEK